MDYTKLGRAQHDELLDIAAKIAAHLHVDELMNDDSEVLSLLAVLLGKLSVHLEMEDQILYPKLLGQADEETKSVARRFIAEMGGIGNSIDAYEKKWLPASEIQKDPSGFIEQTKSVFDVLAARIEKENNEMYELLDEL